MTILSPSISPADGPAPALSAPPQLDTGRGTALFLDFDGTLVELAEHPQDIVVAPALPHLLTALSERLDGRLAVVSGRSLAMLDDFLGPLPIGMAGSHGGEFRPAGSSQVQPLAKPLPPAVSAALSSFAQQNGGLVFEAKPFSAAVHYRNHPEIAEQLVGFATTLSAEHGLAIKHGKMVVELAMPGSDKGSAVRHFMERAPFAGSRPLFIGDDVTDEDAFAAVRQFDGGGVLVGAMRATAALWRLENVSAVHRWLENAA
ncbi:trehalose-phosphatase [Novosphingobium sp. M1R2S20]|uniref:Trehalose 6-phosphate phosphatase n=1 Tax=Novosphingobium rhizovicinum TaxID=3228928 RepID=A0ABV3R9Q6_9SPHN